MAQSKGWISQESLHTSSSAIDAETISDRTWRRLSSHHQMRDSRHPVLEVEPYFQVDLAVSKTNSRGSMISIEKHHDLKKGTIEQISW